LTPRPQDPAAHSDVDALVEHLFRHRAGQMVSRLARWLGSARLDLAEEAAQDALVRALQTWPFGGVPAEPRAWLFQVAKHRAVDLIRRDGALRGKLMVSVARQTIFLRPTCATPPWTTSWP
jgi:RNA polymerase sigma-70 factor (ECF subfamily)